MLSLANLFSSRSLYTKECIKEKNRLERLKKYYEEKISYLSNPRVPPGLAVIVCRDVPLISHDFNSTNHRGYVKTCLNFYKKKLVEVAKNLKKFS